MIFLLNNIFYVRKSCQQHFEGCVGEEFIQRLCSVETETRSQLDKEFWMKALTALSSVKVVQRSGSSVKKSEKAALKLGFATFNSCLEESHTLQATVSVPDQELRTLLRGSMSTFVSPVSLSCVYTNLWSSADVCTGVPRILRFVPISTIHQES